MSQEITLEDFRKKIEEIEGEIAAYQAPSGAIEFDEQNPSPSVDLEKIKQETTKFTAEVKARMFDLIKRFISQESKKEIESQQILQKLSNTSSKLDRIIEILQRNNIE